MWLIYSRKQGAKIATLTSTSAMSFPLIPIWLGIKIKVTCLFDRHIFLWISKRSSIRRLCWWLWKVSMKCNADNESVSNIRYFCVSWVSYGFDIFWCVNYSFIFRNKYKIWWMYTFLYVYIIFWYINIISYIPVDLLRTSSIAVYVVCIQ